MATISYTPKGVCSRKIDIEVEDGIVKKCISQVAVTATHRVYQSLLRA